MKEGQQPHLTEAERQIGGGVLTAPGTEQRIFSPAGPVIETDPDQLVGELATGIPPYGEAPEPRKLYVHIDRYGYPDNRGREHYGE